MKLSELLTDLCEISIETESQLSISTEFLDARAAVQVIANRLKLSQVQTNILLGRVIALPVERPEIVT